MSDFSFPFSFQLDGSGNGSFELTPFFVSTYYQVFNLGANVPGLGSQSTIIQLGSVPYQTAQGSNPQLGPIYLHTQKCFVVVSGGTANAIVQGYIQGAEEATYDALPNLAGPSTNQVSINGGTVNLSGPVAITGPVTVENTNPANLLSGVVGDPLVENQSFTVPNRNLNPNFVPWPAVGAFDISGYGALLIVGDPNVSPPNLPSLWMQILWEDSNGNTISVTQIDSLVPAFAFFVGTQGRKCVVTVFNQDTANHGVSGFNVIPFVEMPSNPAAYLANISAVYGTFQTAPRGAIIAFQFTSMPPGTLVENGSFVYPGRAIWDLGLQSGLGTVNWNAKLSCFDAFNNETIIARMSGTDYNIPPPREVVLTSGLAQITYVNTGTGNQNVWMSLMAA